MPLRGIENEEWKMENYGKSLFRIFSKPVKKPRKRGIGNLPRLPLAPAKLKPLQGIPRNGLSRPPLPPLRLPIIHKYDTIEERGNP
jgi:hypothetical protein